MSFHKPRLLLYIMVIILSGCGGGELPSSQEIVIKENLDTSKIQPISMYDFLVSYENVKIQNPDALNNRDLFSTLIIRNLEGNIYLAKRLSRSTSIDEIIKLALHKALKTNLQEAILEEVIVLAAKTKMNEKEISLLVNYPTNGRLAILDGLTAQAEVLRSFSLCDSRVNSKADAYRHTLWNYLMAKSTSEGFAKSFADAHENGKKELDNLMDLHNNEFGRLLARYYNHDASKISKVIKDKSVFFVSSKEEMVDENLYDYNFLHIYENDRLVDSFPRGGMVYIGSKQKYDGGYSGNLTSGQIFNLDFWFNQCGNSINGYMFTSRTANYGHREIDGIIDENENIVLDVGFPVKKSSSNPCRNVEVTLYTGGKQDNTIIDGIWTSSNCREGGTINISR